MGKYLCIEELGCGVTGIWLAWRRNGKSFMVVEGEVRDGRRRPYAL